MKIQWNGDKERLYLSKSVAQATNGSLKTNWTTG